MCELSFDLYFWTNTNGVGMMMYDVALDLRVFQLMIYYTTNNISWLELVKKYFRSCKCVWNEKRTQLIYLYNKSIEWGVKES